MNAKELGLKKGQKVFEGNYLVKMAELRQAGYTPWSTEDIMDARNGVSAEHPLWGNYIDTDFGIAGSKSKIYLMPHSERLRKVTPETRLTNGGLPLTDIIISTAKVYNRSDLILSRDLTEKEALSSPVWLDFAGGDQKRLEKYVENTFCFGKDKYNYGTMMAINVRDDENERAVVLGRLGGRSRAGGGHLGSIARFVGVRRSASVSERNAPAGRNAKKSGSPYREDPRSDLEKFLDENELSQKELSKAVELYKTAKQLKL